MEKTTAASQQAYIPSNEKPMPSTEDENTALSTESDIDKLGKELASYLQNNPDMSDDASNRDFKARWDELSNRVGQMHHDDRLESVSNFDTLNERIESLKMTYIEPLGRKEKVPDDLSRLEIPESSSIENSSRVVSENPDPGAARSEPEETLSPSESFVHSTESMSKDSGADSSMHSFPFDYQVESLKKMDNDGVDPIESSDKQNEDRFISEATDPSVRQNDLSSPSDSIHPPMSMKSDSMQSKPCPPPADDQVESLKKIDNDGVDPIESSDKQNEDRVISGAMDSPVRQNDLSSPNDSIHRSMSMKSDSMQSKPCPPPVDDRVESLKKMDNDGVGPIESSDEQNEGPFALGREPSAQPKLSSPKSFGHSVDPKIDTLDEELTRYLESNPDMSNDTVNRDFKDRWWRISNRIEKMNRDDKLKSAPNLVALHDRVRSFKERHKDFLARIESLDDRKENMIGDVFPLMIKSSPEKNPSPFIPANLEMDGIMDGMVDSRVEPSPTKPFLAKLAGKIKVSLPPEGDEPQEDKPEEPKRTFMSRVTGFLQKAVQWIWGYFRWAFNL
ncbi:MAG: hypothetical protein AAGE99_01205 [Chlamydiota bacterium]